MTGAYRWEGENLLLTLHVQPRASRNELAGSHGDALKVRITAAPVDGKANAHLVTFLAAEFGVAHSAVELVSGATARRKRFRIRTPEKLPPGIDRAPENPH